jgi:CTP:molybdopterin cytidylyltransferase MocA
VKLGAVILAAGQGTRLGGVAKAMLRTGHETYLERIARIARLSTANRIVVVVGRPHGHEVGAAARALGLGVIVNPLPERGMASSVALGFSAMREYDLDAAWLWPVDHPNVELRTLETLVAALGNHDVAQPRFDGRGGHPPLIARSLWPKLQRCAHLDGGARTVIQGAYVNAVTVDDHAVIRDIDTAADLAGLH